MPNLYENIPELQAQSQANERKRKIAEAMMAQGMEAQTPYTSAGRYVVPMHWTQGMAKAVQAMLGAYQMKQAQKGDDQLAKDFTEGQKKAYEAYTQGREAPKAMTPAALRPEGVTMQGGQVQQATAPTPEDAMANNVSDRDNTMRFLQNPYSSDRQAAAVMYEDTSRRADASEATQLAQAKELKIMDLEQKAEAARQRSEDTRRDDKQRSEDKQMQMALQWQIAQLTATTSAGNRAPSVTEIIDPKDPTRLLKVDTRVYVPGTSIGAPGVVGATSTPELLTSKAQATASGKAIGAAGTQAYLDLPKAEEKARVAKTAMTELLNHPGFSGAVGATWKPGYRFVEGSNEADFMLKLEQAKAGAFLDAYETLKGGGSITEVEGEKATKAKMRMDKSSSEKEFRLAAKDYVEALDTGLRLLTERARSGPVPNASYAPESPGPVDPAAPAGPTRIRLDGNGKIIP